jgi:hypothetical protein
MLYKLFDDGTNVIENQEHLAQPLLLFKPLSIYSVHLSGYKQSSEEHFAYNISY